MRVSKAHIPRATGPHSPTHGFKRVPTGSVAEKMLKMLCRPGVSWDVSLHASSHSPIDGQAAVASCTHDRLVLCVALCALPPASRNELRAVEPHEERHGRAEQVEAAHVKRQLRLIRARLGRGVRGLRRESEGNTSALERPEVPRQLTRPWRWPRRDCARSDVSCRPFRGTRCANIASANVGAPTRPCHARVALHEEAPDEVSLSAHAVQDLGLRWTTVSGRCRSR